MNVHRSIQGLANNVNRAFAPEMFWIKTIKKRNRFAM